MPIPVWIPLIIGLICLFFPGFLISKRKSEVQQRKNVKRIRNCGWLLILASALFFLSSMLSGQSFRGVPDVEDIAVKANKRFPRMIDKDTRIDGVTSGDNQLIYNCTLINHRAADIDQVMFAEHIENEIRATTLNDKYARKFLENGISLRIDYYSADNYLLVSIELPANSQDDQE